MKDETRVISTEEELKIFSDPYRMRIVKAYQSFGTPLTVKQVADHMKEVPAKVHYHVKKLLSIKVLELDHVEVINGINAKYYFLPKRHFAVQLKDKEAAELYKQLNHVEIMLADMIDSFKKDLFTASKLAVEKKIEDETEVGMLTGKDIYLSEEEYKQLAEDLAKISEKYGLYDENKKKYSYLAGFTKKQ